MRIASDQLYNQLARGLRDHLTNLAEITNQLATGKKTAKPSDDVLGTLKAMDYKLTISQNDQYGRNITEAITSLDFNETALTEVSTALTSLKQMTTIGGGAVTDTERSSYALQAANLRDLLLDLSNSQFENRTIYSGFLSDEKAYVFDPTTYRYVYQGDDGQFNLPIDNDIGQTINFVGSSDDSSKTTAFSYTLPAPETNTLADGSLVTYTAVADPAHNSTTIEVQITHPDHLGDPSYEDTFSFSNFMDMANILNHAWEYEDIDGITSLSQSKSMKRVEALAIPLDKAADQVLFVRSELGIRQVHLNDQKSRLEADTINQQDNLAQTEEASMDKTIIELHMIMTNLNALRSASSKILSQSLFDFLR